jgi:hypothetical protein
VTRCQKCQKPSKHPFGTFVTPLVGVFGETTCSPQSYTRPLERSSSSLLCALRTFECQYFIDTISRSVYNFCMMLVMVKEADLNRIDVPEDYEVLDATALGRRLGFKRDTVLAYLSRRNFRRIPRPQPPACYGAHLVREERQRVGS